MNVFVHFTDEQLNVTDLSTPIELTFPLTVGLTNVEYSCVYWDTSSDAWSTSGLTTTDSGGGNIVCSTTHLTVFTVLGIPIPTTLPPTTTDGMGGTTTQGKVSHSFVSYHDYTAFHQYFGSDVT